jgi:glycosyltransferase involved in cell wall biosynthesis
MWKKLPLIKEQDILKLHWGGGSSHTEDIMMVEDAICTVLDKYPHVHLSIAGVKWEWSFKSVPEDRITYTGWTPTPAYPYVSAIQNPDIGFIPLIDNPFNRCKSNLKWIEMGSMGVPCVMSNVTPYKEAYDGKNAIMVDNTHKAWVKGLEVLINDPDLRAKIGQAAQDTVLRDFDIHKKYVLWEQAYKELINGR